jgi:very-short-patch-repair endonuclease
MPKRDFHKNAQGKLFEYARNMRKNQTAAEDLLWQNLRGRKLGGHKFRRQHPVAGFIADFYCHEAKLVIELDGKMHNLSEQKEYDWGRTHDLKEHGLRVIRFTNEEVETNILLVLEEIRNALTKN